VVYVHPLAELFFGLILHRDVDQHPRFLPVQSPDLKQLVGQPQAQLPFSDNLLEFLVQTLIPSAPVDSTENVRKEERQEPRQKPFYGFFPGAVVFTHQGTPHG